MEIISVLSKIKAKLDSFEEMGKQDSNEYRAFYSKYSSLLLNHNISESEIEIDDQEFDDFLVTGEELYGSNSKRRNVLASFIWNPIKDYVGVCVISNVGSNSITVVGRKTQVKTFTELFVRAYKAANTLCKKGYKKQFGIKMSEWKKSYFIGFARSLKESLEAQKEEDNETGKGSALIVVNSTSKDALNWYKENSTGQVIKTERKSVGIYGTPFNLGKKDGDGFGKQLT